MKLINPEQFGDVKTLHEAQQLALISDGVPRNKAEMDAIGFDLTPAIKEYLTGEGKGRGTKWKLRDGLLDFYEMPDWNYEPKAKDSVVIRVAGGGLIVGKVWMNKGVPRVECALNEFHEEWIGCYGPLP